MFVLKGRNKCAVSLRSLQDRISLVACDLGLRFACPRLLAMAPSAPYTPLLIRFIKVKPRAVAQHVLRETRLGRILQESGWEEVKLNIVPDQALWFDTSCDALV